MQPSSGLRRLLSRVSGRCLPGIDGSEKHWSHTCWNDNDEDENDDARNNAHAHLHVLRMESVNLEHLGAPGRSSPYLPPHLLADPISSTSEALSRDRQIIGLVLKSVEPFATL